MSVSANWAWTRRLLAVAGLLTWLPRGAFVPEVYSSAGVVVATGELPLPSWFVFSPAQAWMVWGALVVCLGGLLLRPSRVLSAIVVLAGILLVYSEGIDEKAYDRLFLFQMMVLTWAGDGASPSGKDARIALLLVFAALYGSTGWSKLLYEPAWADGGVLPGHLVDVHFGLRPLGLLAVQQGWLLTAMGWGTVAFEALFPFLVWVPRARPALLLLGAAFHVGIYATMNVSTFSLIALAGYPAMCASGEWAAVAGWLRRGRVAIGGVVAGWAIALAVPWAVARWMGPWSVAAWTPPDTALLTRVGANLQATRDEDPSALVAARWGSTTWARGAGSPVTLCASAATGSANDRTGLVVLLTLAEVLPDTLPVRLHLVAGAPADPPTGAVFWIGPIGHHATHRGSQVWPGTWWGWILTERGTFLGFSGGVPGWWQARSSVDTMTLPGDWTPEGMPPGTITLTDTGWYRSPGRGADSRAEVDLDQVARVVAAFASYVTDPPP